jgi:adenosylcobinamide-phosphate synthase
MGIAILIAVAADMAFGEPKTPCHPIALVGRAMGRIGKVLHLWAKTPLSRRIMGTFLVAGLVVTSFVFSSLVINLVRYLFPDIGWVGDTLFIWLSISVGELIITCKKINSGLEAGSPEEARRQLRCLVGRDLDSLTDRQIRAASLESLAENLVDAGVAPLLYALLGGGALAFTYRIINTMDSMFGYKNETFIDFGWASARLDDIASWVPARLTVICLVSANALCGHGFRDGIRAVFSDGAKHPSPNSGLPMAAMAGALGIQLGGQRLYNGEAVVYGYFGESVKQITAGTVHKASGLVTRAFFASATAGILIGAYFKGVSWLIS